MIPDAEIEYLNTVARLLLEDLRSTAAANWLALKSSAADLAPHELHKDQYYISFLVDEPAARDLELWIWRDRENPYARLWFGIESTDRFFVTRVRDNLGLPFVNWTRGARPAGTTRLISESYRESSEFYLGIDEITLIGDHEPLEQFRRRCHQFIDAVCLWWSEQAATQELERLQQLGVSSRRVGQRDFSKALQQNYGGRCAITGCNTSAALQAAHISLRQGADDNSPVNGILLRADIHALFDALLITFSPDGRSIEVSSSLIDPSYDFLKNGMKIAKPIIGPPSLENITDHRQRFREHNGLL